MLEVKTREEKTHTVGWEDGRLMVDGKTVSTDMVRIGDQKYHVLVDARSITIELIRYDKENHSMEVMVNGIRKTIEVRDQYDILLKELKMDKMMGSKANDIKAPMPGLVLKMMVKEGDSVKAGDPLLVLEAMKMENVIKSHGDAVVGKILVSEKTAVEKGQVLIHLT